MKPFCKSPALVFACFAVLLTVAMAIPRLVGSFGLAWSAEARERARARRQFVPQLERIDAAFASSAETSRDDMKAGDCAMEFGDELESRMQISGPVLGVFTLPTEHDDGLGLTVSDDEDKEKSAVCGRVEDAWKVVESEVLHLANQAGTNVVSGVQTLVLGDARVQLVWHRLSVDGEFVSGVQVCGFVVDYRFDMERKSMLELVWTALVCIVVLLVALVGVLAFHLRRARREALQKTTFVSNVSHELRTPLTSMLSYAEMLATGRCRTDEKKAKAIGVILDEGHRLDRMIRELLDFSRLERGVRRYQKESFDLSETVRETVDRLAARFDEHGLSVDVPERFAVYSDRDTVRGVLENLLTNAAKYAARGGPVEIVAAHHGDRARLTVSDRGPGMTRVQMRCAFRPFWRADNSTTREVGGYGIGLSVARAYARGLGGDLTVSARAGGGCAFTFEFPIKEEE